MSQCLKKARWLAQSVSYRQEVRPFTDKQIELGQELRCSGRHRHRERAVAQRTAPAHHGRLTSRKRWSSRRLPLRCSRLSVALPAILQPVFASMLENAVRICDAKFGNIYRWDGEALAPRRDAQYAARLRRRIAGVRRIVPIRISPRSHAGDQSGRSHRRLAHGARLH